MLDTIGLGLPASLAYTQRSTLLAQDQLETEQYAQQLRLSFLSPRLSEETDFQPTLSAHDYGTRDDLTVVCAAT